MSDREYVIQKLYSYIEECINSKKFLEASGAIEFVKTFGSIDVNVFEDKLNNAIQQNQ